MPDESDRKDLSIEDVQQIIENSMAAHERAKTVAYVDEKIYLKGTELVVGKNRYRMTSDTILVFIDDEPGKNWAHNCRYFLFDIQTGKFREIQERFPPSFPEMPKTFRIIWTPE